MAFKRFLSRDKRKYVLPSERALGHDVHSYMPELSDQLFKGKIDRRDFLRQSALLGVSAGAAYVMADKLTGQSLIGAARADGHGTPKNGGVLRVSMPVQEVTDPASFSWTEPSNISRWMVEYLVRTGADNVTVPYLAEGWEASDDLKSWVFHLQKNVTWSNGDQFGADDVVAAITRWLDPETGSSNLSLFSSLTETDAEGKTRAIAGAVEKVDDHTVRLNLKKASVSIPENFYNYPTAITHKGFGVDYEANLEQNPIGTGCMEMTEYAVGEKAIFRKNRDWWAGNFYLDGIDYYDHGSDTNAWFAALVSGQVDTLFRMPNELVEAAKKIPTLQMVSTETAQTGVMRFRISEEPFGDKRVRQAVVAAMDNAEILEKAYRGLGSVGENHHVSPIHPEYAKLPPLKRDIAKAKALLAEAGYPDGITLSIANGDTDGSWMTDACTVMKSQVAEAGINVEINKMPSNQYWEVWDKAPWGYTTWTHRPLGTMVLSLGYRAGVPWNETNYNNPAFDAALDEAEATLDVNERRKKVEVCQRLLQDDAIIPQPFWRSQYNAVSKRVKGRTMHPTNYNQFQDVWIDE